MKKIYILTTIALLSSFITPSMAATGDTTHVITHQNAIMTTDPGGSGTNENKVWATFPAAGTSYRKAFVMMTYKCPDGMACGEWDYIDQILLRRSGPRRRKEPC